VSERLQRYRLTDGWNLEINRRQFGWLAQRNFGIGGGAGADLAAPFLPDDLAEPDVTYDLSLPIAVGGTEIELHHARGETDDHTWAWLPGARAVCSGDFLIWNFPNAGNPQKVQRYPDSWARALRAMVAKEPDLLLPAHGLPIAGRERIATVLTDVADVLEQIVADVVGLMNNGADLDQILHSVTVPADTLARPYLRPLYDEPEFAIRNIWRLYGGWWDGNPARLKPPADHAVATEVAALAGGPGALAERADAVADSGDLRLACQLMEWAHQAGTDEDGIAERRRALYERRSHTESSLMAKGIFRSVEPKP
jgi:alkyl sulfatase BDS1-like metallo-beta-lactamase superfamily hydrolase